jgi:hypothetical protein
MIFPKWPIYQLDLAIDGAPTMIVLNSAVEAARCRYALRRRLRRRRLHRRIELKGCQVIITKRAEPPVLHLERL